MLFKWREHEHGLDSWKPHLTFSTTDSASQPRDYFTEKERSKLREAALEYGSIPSYSDLSPDERDQWRTYLSQRYGKPKRDVTPADWDRANGWKIPSLVAVSLDTGLRPIEVRRARTQWIDIGNQVLRIPKEESSKNTENWIVSLQDLIRRLFILKIFQSDPIFVISLVLPPWRAVIATITGRFDSKKLKWKSEQILKVDLQRT